MQILLVMGAELDRESTVMKTRKWLGAGNFSGEKAWPKEIPTRVPESSVESSAVEWAAIIGGALAAIGVTIISLALGPLGLATVSPWSFGASPPTTFGIAAGICLIVTQWMSSGLGGYLAGRLRKKWVGIPTDEVFFRDTAHGFLAWALATIIVAALVSLASAITAAAAASATATTGAPAVTPEAAEVARNRGTGNFSENTANSLSGSCEARVKGGKFKAGTSSITIVRAR